MYNKIILTLLVSFAFCVSEDVNTFSNYHDVQIKHLNLEWILDLDSKWINATAEYKF